MEHIILGLGSNKGDSQKILSSAIEDFKEFVFELKIASLYITAPMHVTSQPEFYNTAISGKFDGTASNLLKKIHIIEKKFGRNREEEQRWGQRSLDIDILVFGGKIINIHNDDPQNDIEIPHPRLCERRFALEPLIEISSLEKDPISGELYCDIANRLPNQGVRRVL
jgi:2-amino-4-hydroxy-6-hydroxymethyldihydropteridine diphosphokinase